MMSKLKTKKVTFVRYVGYRSTVSRNSSIGNPYHFRKNKWLEVGDNDVDFYVVKAKADDSWEVKIDDKKVLKAYYYVQWMSNTPKQRLAMSLTDKDQNGIVIANTLREYIFNNRVWVKINDQDIIRFKAKAEGNASWKFEKAYLQEGREAPFTVGTLTVQESFDRKEKKMASPKNPQKITLKQKVLARMTKEPIVDKDVIAPSSTEKKTEEEPKATIKKVVKVSSKKPKKESKENDE